MKYLEVGKSLVLKQLSNIVKSSNVSTMLKLNNVERTPYIGKAFDAVCKAAIASTSTVSWETKKSILNTLTSNEDVFEAASLLGQSGWKLLASDVGTLPGYMKVPDNVNIPQGYAVLGNGNKVNQKVYDKVMAGLEGTDHNIDPGIFSSYNTDNFSNITQNRTPSVSGVMSYFPIPWGDVVLYSSIDGESVEIPCYPEDMEDVVRANYGQMPDMLYQYEPWMVYNSSGPRSNTYTFDIHRDMWDDHNNGKANNLIRFCQANCYPRYSGSAVHSPVVTLYVAGSPLIRGIMTEVSTNYDGPLGHDKFYLHFKLSLTIQEVSSTALNYDVIRNKSLIG